MGNPTPPKASGWPPTPPGSLGGPPEPSQASKLASRLFPDLRVGLPNLPGGPGETLDYRVGLPILPVPQGGYADPSRTIGWVSRPFLDLLVGLLDF